METICLNGYNEALIQFELVFILSKGTGNNRDFTNRFFTFNRNLYYNMVKLFQYIYLI